MFTSFGIGRACRTLHWVRGLKLQALIKRLGNIRSHSSLSAWIETFFWYDFWRILFVALFIECVDWNKDYMYSLGFTWVSHSSLSAWIETHHPNKHTKPTYVALFIECVDWNIDERWDMQKITSHSSLSAWIETGIYPLEWEWFASHSSLSAWIETSWSAMLTYIKHSRTLHWVRGLKRLPATNAPEVPVALFIECVDWNG